MKRLVALVGPLSLMAFAAAAWAIEGWDLTSSDVREAYFLGQRRDERLAKFLADYVKRLPAPASGPRVAVIQVSTPYHQVVKRSWRRAVGYSSQQAQREYDANADLLLVNVTVNLMPGDVTMMRELGFWQQFDVRLVQGEEARYPRRMDGELIYSGADSYGGGNHIIGFELFAEFTTRQVNRAPLCVEVLTHDKQTVSAEFNLTRLK